MLNNIHIWNFAIVEQLDLSLDSGLTVMTGETGAGKSILLDALGLALGDRAESSVIRHGADKAEVSVTFSTQDNPDAEAWLQERELASENECIIRRVVYRNSSSKAFINGVPSPVTALRELGEMLVDLHGQHEHQSLLKKDLQRELLDDYAGHADLLNKLQQQYQTWKKVNAEYESLRQAQQDRDSRLDLLRYQVNELETLGLKAGEAKELDQEHKRLANAKDLIQNCDHILKQLTDADQKNVSDILNQSNVELGEMSATDPKLESIAELLNGALIQVQEASSELRHYLDGMELDPERLDWIEQRLSDVHELSRKHHMNADELPDLLPQLKTELDTLEKADESLEQLKAGIDTATKEYRSTASKLSKSRTKFAKQLSKQVTDSMQTLGMEGGVFQIDLMTDNNEQFSAQGMEKIEFMVCANPGQTLKPLAKVASGGELSRISLSIQVKAAEQVRIPTLVFDEVDVGIGGRVAEIVGYLLRDLASHRQVLCVTHLPQVAALGHHHLQVQKQVDNNVTVTSITPLDELQRIDEVARMLGGMEITEQTLSHAKEMLDKAQI